MIELKEEIFDDVKELYLSKEMLKPANFELGFSKNRIKIGAKVIGRS